MVSPTRQRGVPVVGDDPMRRVSGRLSDTEGGRYAARTVRLEIDGPRAHARS